MSHTTRYQLGQTINCRKQGQVNHHTTNNVDRLWEKLDEYSQNHEVQYVDLCDVSAPPIGMCQIFFRNLLRYEIDQYDPIE